MKLSLHAEETELDVDLTVSSDMITVGDLFVSAGLTVTGRFIVNGYTPCDGATPLSALGLCDGAVLMSHRDEAEQPLDLMPTSGLPGRPEVSSRQEPVVELVCVAGPGTGMVMPLPPGTFDLCLVLGQPIPARQLQSSLFRSSMLRVEVSRSGMVRFGALASTKISVDDAPVGESPQAGTWVTVADAVFRVAESAQIGRGLNPIRGLGTMAYVRPPRVMPEHQPKPVVAPKPQREPGRPEPLSLLVMLLPLPLGLALAFFLSPFYLMFILLSPVMALGRNLEGRRRVKRVTKENLVRRQEDLGQFRAELRQQARELARHRRSSHRDLHQILKSAMVADTELWRSRSHHPDFLRPAVGIGEGHWTPEVLGDASAPDLEQAVDEAATISMCPVTVDLNRGLATGLVGPKGMTRRLAVALVAQLVTAHGPADLRLGAVVDDEAARFWDHLKWLPHLVDETGALRVATTHREADQLVQAMVGDTDQTRFTPGDNSPPTPVPMFLIDHEDLVNSGVRCLAGRVPGVVARAIVVAETADQLPAFCTSVIEIGAVGGRVTLTDVASGQRTTNVFGFLPDPELGRDIGRALARFTDPDADEQAIGLPSFARLRDLLPVDPDANSVRRAWAAGDGPSLRAVLGATELEPLEVDLLRDGPHTLIAGTTGAGKSELLRTMIVSLAAGHRPDQVSFVLIDFKGGGAFDVFEHLPHNVGVVTDLDEHLAARALRCLQAELKNRERRLRAAGVSDLIDFPVGGTDGLEPMPRLVIVVDEFATLAAELPDFLASLVDVAQRGRSLGIHMVLATQRPSGVVDAKIRANTNLRIALRVQDDHDSVDVIGSGAAADIDRRHPGRALARFGASELRGFQTALVTIHSSEADGPPMRLVPFDLVGHDDLANTEDEPLPPPLNSNGRGETALDDLTAYVEATRIAHQQSGLADPRVPWPDPLPVRLAAEPLLATAAGVEARAGWATPFGLIDRPDEQRQEVAWWRADDGNVLFYGLGPGPGAAAVSTLVLGLAHRHRSDELHLYILDFVGSLAALRDLPHVGGYVTTGDDERLLRVIGRVEAELDRRRAVVRQRQLDGLNPNVGSELDLPLIVLTIANFGAVLEIFDEIGELGGAARLTRIIRDGSSLGVVVFIAAGSERDVPGRVAQQIETKLILRMADPNSYLMFGLRPKDLPELGPGRAIDVRDQSELQVAQFGGGNLREAVEATRWDHSSAMRGPASIEVLGSDIGLEALATASRVDGSTWHLSVGIGHERLIPVGLDLRTGQHLTITGPVGSGKTVALQTLAHQARLSDPTATIVVVSPRPEEWDDIGRALRFSTLDDELSADQSKSVQTRLLVIVDGFEGVGVPAEVFEQLATQPRPGAHLAVSGRPESFRVHQAWIRSVNASRTGIALPPSAETGDVFRCRLIAAGEPPPPGRASVINQGQSQLAQIARGAGPWPRTESEGGDVVANEVLEGEVRVDEPMSPAVAN